jgi:hypothetical protein
MDDSFSLDIRRSAIGHGRAADFEKPAAAGATSSNQKPARRLRGRKSRMHGPTIISESAPERKREKIKTP